MKTTHASTLFCSSHAELRRRRPRTHLRRRPPPSPPLRQSLRPVTGSTAIRFKRRIPKRSTCSTGAGAGVRVQPRGRDPVLRARLRAGSGRPDAALGTAWALGPNYNLDIDDTRAQAAYDAISKASRSRHSPGSERAYIDALAVRYSADMKADRAALARTYSRAMGELSRRYPDDLDAAVIYAESLMNLTPWKLWTLDGKPAPNTEQIVARARIHPARNPNHLGRQPLLHSRGRSLEHPGARAAEREAPCHAGRAIRPSAAHAGAHLRANRRSRGGRRRQRSRRCSR